ncbi:MAG: hypothetical protein AAFY31_05865 [Pseudomonadota bacterium]
MLEHVLVLQIGTGLATLVGAGVMFYGMRSAGRDRPMNEAAVKALLRDAPYERLDNLVSKEK